MLKPQSSPHSVNQVTSGILPTPQLSSSHNFAGNLVSWIIDTGATDHMVNSIAYFFSITSKVASIVKLPNGHSVPVTHIGSVHVPLLARSGDIGSVFEAVIRTCNDICS
ncbi:hypothetical protein F2P56_021127 [Juglans regia]|uniref:Retrovirus-related Pol polyprotein from transposon TNT 1-94-like beta-barrel domain-containing protein n=1 Tax=Juglans regia TaxID=51240 RepID=A0A833X3Y5_JUGRE|nr:hypothetical protein F2P56_021127 [Juglans regia]